MVSANGPILLIPMAPNSSNQKKEGSLYVSYTTLRKMIIDWLSNCLLGLLLVNSILNITEMLSFTCPKAYIILWGGFPKFPPLLDFPSTFWFPGALPFGTLPRKLGLYLPRFATFCNCSCSGGQQAKDRGKAAKAAPPSCDQDPLIRKAGSASSEFETCVLFC